MVKYKKAFNEMLKDYNEFFAEFKKTCEKFETNPDDWGEKFNEQGVKVLRIVRRYENALCSRSENTGYGKFSENLSEKFWEEVRGYFPLIDRVEIA